MINLDRVVYPGGIVLVSASPRRREYMAHLGVAFTTTQADVDETFGKGCVQQEVVALAQKKALSVAAQYPNALVIGADTVVFLKDVGVLGKPKDQTDAHRMLRALSGAQHTVYTGVCLHDTAFGRTYLHCEATLVHFAPLTDEELDEYILTGEPMDKAGAYGIQGFGGKFITAISGCFYNVAGFPLNRVYNMLQTALSHGS